jgi:hypothetical protein
MLQRGHLVRNCPKGKKNEAANVSRDHEIALIGQERGEIDPSLWIGDSGATSHITCSKIGMSDIKPSSQNITVGDGRHLKVKKTGKLRICFEGREQKTTEVLLENVKYVPEMKVNLFSLTVAMEKGASLYSEGTSVVLKKGGKEIYFDTKIKMGSSFLVAAKSTKNEAALVVSERKEMKIVKFHQMLGHPSIKMTKETAKRIGLKLTGSLKECNVCMLAKVMQKNICKSAKNNSKVPGERLLLDISFIKKISLGKRNIWTLIEDQLR